MPKQYFFQAGTFHDLSYAELSAVFEIYDLNTDIIHKFTDDIFLIKSKDISEDLLLNIFNRLGGFIRFGYIIEDLDTFLDEYTKRKSRVVFGLSVLGQRKREDPTFLKKLGNELKRGFKEYNISSRFLFPRGKDLELNAAQLDNNGVLKKGFELCILRNDREEIYANTLLIQDIEAYIKRDTQRPYSDVDMGVLPPKLARMMVNLTALKEGTVWDPFCGSGTVPMESALLGYNFLASDVDDNAIYYTQENIKWLNTQGDIGNIVHEIFKLDVMNPDWEVLKKLKNTPISAIVCEPYMGPPLKRVISEVKADELLENVKSLYLSLFDMLDEKIGVRGSKMVLILPSYKTDRGWKTIGIRDIITNRW
jgi:tRNA G10  N-methylase Trm11